MGARVITHMDMGGELFFRKLLNPKN